MMKDFKPGQDFVLERNPGYYEQGADGKALPYLDQVRDVVFGDKAAEQAALRTGQLDITNSFAFSKDEAGAMLRAQPKLHYFRQLQPVVFGVWFNHKRAPANNEKLRKAVVLAVDPDAVVDSLGGEGGAVRSGFVPSFFSDYAWSEDEHRRRYRQDIEQAKRLLAEAGYGPGQPKLVFKTINSYQQQAEIVLENLKAIGIDARLEVAPSSITAVIREGDFDLAWGGRVSQLYVSYWVGELIRTGSTLNDTGFSDPVVDRLVDAQGREMNVRARKESIDQLQARLYETSASLPVVSYYYHLPVSCRLQNWKPMNPTYNISTVVMGWLDSAGC